MTNRRAHVRLLDCELVVIHWNDEGQERRQIANVDDVSLGGMRVRVDQLIPVGTPITVSYETLFEGALKATVKHQVECPEDFYLGIGFDSENVDSMLLFYPELFSSEALDPV